MTGQEQFDRYVDAGAFVAVDLVDSRRQGEAPVIRVTELARILAVDPASVRQLNQADEAGFARLSDWLDAVFAAIAVDQIDDAADRLNALLALYPAHPHLAKESGRWRLHHHPPRLPLVPMWTAICAESLARIVASGEAARLGTCDAHNCNRVYLDESKNARRRYCSTTCNNRARSASYRRRRTP